MAVSVGNVLFGIQLDLRDVQSQLNQLNSTFDSNFSKMSQTVSGFARTVAGTLGIGFSVGGLVAFVDNVVRSVSALEDLSQKTGFTAQALSAIRPIAEQSGASIEEFATGVTRAIRNLADSGAAGDKARQSLQSLGFSAAQLKQFTAEPEQFISEFVQKLSDIENPSKRAAVAWEILGRQGANLIPTMLRLAQATRDLGGFDALKATGIDDQTVESIKRFSDSLVSIKNTLIAMTALPLAELASFLRQIGGAFGYGSGPTPQDRLKSIDLQIEALMNRARTLAPGGSTPAQPSGELLAVTTKIAELQKTRDQIQNGVNELKKAFQPSEIVSDAAVKKTQELYNNFIESLRKSLASFKAEEAAAFGGPLAKEATTLDAQLEEVKNKFKEAGLALPAGLQSAFDTFKKQILDADKAAIQAKFDFEALMKTLEEMSGESPKAGPRGVTNVYSLGERDQQISAQEQYTKLMQQFAREAIATDPFNPQGSQRAQRIAAIQDEYQQRIDSIKKWYDAAVAANVNETTSESLKNDEMARLDQQRSDLVVAAYKAEETQIRGITDDMTQFEVEAFRKMQDGISGIVDKLLSGQIKSWRDLGNAVKQVLDSIASQYLGLVLKNALFGPGFGGAGISGPSGASGSLGGLLGSAANWIGTTSIGQWLGFGGAAAASTAGVTATAVSNFGALGLLFHEGGVVRAGGPSRLVDPSVFVGARRYHSGVDYLAPDEVPAILQTGERIIPRGGSAGVVVNMINPQVADRRSTALVETQVARAVKAAQTRHM